MIGIGHIIDSKELIANIQTKKIPDIICYTGQWYIAKSLQQENNYNNLQPREGCEEKQSSVFFLSMSCNFIQVTCPLCIKDKNNSQKFPVARKLNTSNTQTNSR